jgi:hypothetical protein
LGLAVTSRGQKRKELLQAWHIHWFGIRGYLQFPEWKITDRSQKPEEGQRSNLNSLKIQSNFLVTQPIQYPKHDRKLTFDLLDNLIRSGTNHNHDQPSHLVVKPGKEDKPQISLKRYAAPEER